MQGLMIIPCSNQSIETINRSKIQIFVLVELFLIENVSMQNLIKQSKFEILEVNFFQGKEISKILLALEHWVLL